MTVKELIGELQTGLRHGDITDDSPITIELVKNDDGCDENGKQVGGTTLTIWRVELFKVVPTGFPFATIVVGSDFRGGQRLDFLD